MAEDMVSIAEAATKLRLTRQGVHYLVRKHQVCTRKIGSRFTLVDLNALLALRTPAAEAPHADAQ